MIAGGDIYLHIWFDPLVSNLHIFFSLDDTVQVERLQCSGLRIYNQTPWSFSRFNAFFNPPKFAFFVCDECFWWLGLKRLYPTATWVLPRRPTEVTFRNSSFLIIFNFKVRARWSRLLLFCTRFIHPQGPLRLGGTDYLKITSVILERLLSDPSGQLHYLFRDSWMGFPGDLLLSDPPRNYRWLSIMTILNFMVHRSCSTGTPTPQLPEDFWNVK